MELNSVFTAEKTFPENHGNIDEKEEIIGGLERNTLKIQGAVSHETYLIQG